MNCVGIDSIATCVVPIAIAGPCKHMLRCDLRLAIQSRAEHASKAADKCTACSACRLLAMRQQVHMLLGCVAHADTAAASVYRC